MLRNRKAAVDSEHESIRGNSSQAFVFFSDVGYYARISQPHGPLAVDQERFKLSSPTTMYTDETNDMETRVLHDLASIGRIIYCDI